MLINRYYYRHMLVYIVIISGKVCSCERDVMLMSINYIYQYILTTNFFLNLLDKMIFLVTSVKSVGVEIYLNARQM